MESNFFKVVFEALMFGFLCKNLAKYSSCSDVYLANFSFVILLTSKAKFSGSFGGELSPRKLLHNLSASRFVIIPHRRDEIGMAPALRRISS